MRSATSPRPSCGCSPQGQSRHPPAAVLEWAPTPRPYAPVPSSMDWRTRGAVTPIKDQGQCGSCWIFSAIGALEGQTKIRNGTLQDLSEQEVIDCYEPKTACNGGSPYAVYNWAKTGPGICSEASVPYLPPSPPLPPPPPLTCDLKNCTQGVPKGAVTGTTFVTQNNATAFAEALAFEGPLSILVDASPLIQYHSGIIAGNCADQYSLDHAILAVGYGVEDEKEYWIVKNSWGTSWGEDGYGRLLRNDKECAGYGTGEIGILFQPIYPTLA